MRNMIGSRVKGQLPGSHSLEAFLIFLLELSRHMITTRIKRSIHSREYTTALITSNTTRSATLSAQTSNCSNFLLCLPQHAPMLGVTVTYCFKNKKFVIKYHKRTFSFDPLITVCFKCKTVGILNQKQSHGPDLMLFKTFTFSVPLKINTKIK